MKIAKATNEDINACIDLAALLNTVDDGYYPSTEEEEGDILFFDPDDPAHLRLFYDKVKACMYAAPGGMNRVVWGFGAAMDRGVFDPDLDYLEVNPRLNGDGAMLLKGKVLEIGPLVGLVKLEVVMVYEESINHDGFPCVLGPGDGLGYYAHTLSPELSCGNPEEAGRAAKIANIAYRAGYAAAQKSIREAIGLTPNAALEGRPSEGE